MHGVALLLIAASVGHLLARRLRVSPIPMLLISGVVATRVAPPPERFAEDVLVLGASVLLFLAGLELDPKRMRGQTRAALGVGTVQFGVLMALAYGTAAVLGFGARASAYVAVALAASSTLVGVRLLQGRRQLYEPVGRLVLGVLLLQDAVVLVSIPLLGSVDDLRGAAVGLGAVSVLALLAALVRARAAPRLLALTDDPQLVLLAPLTVLFAFLAIGYRLNLPTVVGAFLAGVALARFPVNGIVRAEFAPIGDFFTALFFTALGALIQTPTAVQAIQAGVLAIVVIGATVPVVTWSAERAGFSAKPAIEAGLLLSQTSEISLVIGLAGMLQGHIDPSLFTVITLVTVATMLLTPFLATDRVVWWLMRMHPARRAPSATVEGSGHVLLLGAGSTGMQLLEGLLVAGVDVVVVDDDAAVLRRVAEAGLRTVRGDAADRRSLRRAGAERARVIVSTVRRPRDNRAVFRLAPGVPVLVRVFDEADAVWVQARGGTPILHTEASADALMDWIEEPETDLEGRLHRRRAGIVP